MDSTLNLNQLKNASNVSLPQLSRSIHTSFQFARMIAAKVTQMNRETQKVLVADDEALTFELIQEFFKDANIHCKVLHAQTGRKAYELALSEIPDLIITDWIMPEFDGPDLIKKLKANQATKDIPVIMTTGASFSDKLVDQVFEAGAVNYILKPIEENELIALVKPLLNL